MRTRPDGTRSHGLRHNLFKLLRGQRSPNPVNNNNDNAPISTATDGDNKPEEQEPQHVAEIPTFEQLLVARQFCEADRLLIEREELLFGDKHESEPLAHHDQEVEKLNSDRSTLKSLILQTLSLSLNASEIDVTALTSAVKTIHQEEDQDRRWMQQVQMAPVWRPCGWMELHDLTLCDLVEKRLDDPSTSPFSNLNIQSSIQRDVLGMGRQLKDDLVFVVEVLKRCYPLEMDVCNFYAKLYHQTFSARLRKIADFVLEDKDCTLLLRWVNEFYPQILQKPELVGEIDDKRLGKLLPEDLLEPLEQQFINTQQEELETFIGRVLEEEKTKWSEGNEPIREDGYFVCTVAYDIIQLINGKVTSAETIVGDRQKAQKITHQLNDFLKSLRSFQNDVMKQNKSNSGPVVKATLNCIEQFRDFLHKKNHLFPEEVKENCLTVLKEMQQSAHTYLLNPVHKVLKPHWCMLGTNEWLSKDEVFDKLKDALEKELQDLQGSSPSCHQSLIGRLHEEATAEYVKRLFKGKIKLKDKRQQLEASTRVREDAESLHQLFSRTGSKDDWSKDILTPIAEVLKLQELPSIQMQVVSLATDFPDLSTKHVSALIKLKANVSRADRRNIKETLQDVLSETNTDGARTFFSKVQVK